ncbi:hydroxyproline O-galactosyltransferase GALT3 [Dioscorea cayenensis subsp. rotundata]|uniref:Hydroxyproline O-galactosyltransferase GALT3 n=1 Tax=Dioscorea cayennensis subsp. rotundata TaxID=55577 RepID=A0AB40BLQ2_DIOCR|nr:hydroxyproline O-galactosyltransferase GALT3 [Dioscorea cayenensis subsp. rotundata]
MKMKRWCGGSLILFLALMLTLSYTLFPSTIKAPPPSSAAGIHPPPSPPPPPKPQLLVSLPGLADLFSRSFLGLDHNLAWSHLRTLLSRSDAISGTADGVREGAVAWRELQDTLEAEKLEKVAPWRKKCPFLAGGNEGFVEIPCGFVDGSAVSIVGIPVGFNGSSTGAFRIELVGSGVSDEIREPPIVLRVNVSFGGDASKELPVVSMNSWSPDEGWGPWEQCPAPAIVAHPKVVDELVRCNEGNGESVMQEKINVSVTPSRTSKGSARMSDNMPFVEGHPFSATLWTGMEGFHLTVNGRHETSFAYREKLDPWSVSGVRLEGDLEILSCIANGLPVSEDLDVVSDIDSLKAPPLPKKRILMLVVVFSTGNNFERRMAIRRSWMQYEAVRSGEVAVRFFIGLHKNKQVNLELWKEAQTYGDIQLMPFVDYYSLITLKTITMCIFGIKILAAKYIMKTDDDAFVRIDEVLSSLKKNVPQGLLYGQIAFESSPHRDKDSKWYISPEEWPHDSYPPWAHGPGYIISRDIAKFVVQGHQERNLQLFKLEDVAMGIWIQEYKRSGKEVNYVSDDRFHNEGCESNYVLAHYQVPRTLLCLWDNLRRNHEPICCD